jgi:hypothetical protein
MNCDCPLNIKLFHHTSVEEFQSRQWPWVRFQNPPLLCLLLCMRTLPHSFCLHGEEDGQAWWDWRGQFWVNQVGVSHGSRQPSFQVLLTAESLLFWRMYAQMIGSSGWWPSVRLTNWCPWRNILTRPGCFGLCWRFKPCLTLNIISRPCHGVLDSLFCFCSSLSWMK